MPRVARRPGEGTLPDLFMRRIPQVYVGKVGLVLLVIGAAPLLTIIFAARRGLWPDPNPEPGWGGLAVCLNVLARDYLASSWESSVSAIAGAANPRWSGP